MDDFEYGKGLQTAWDRWLAGPPRLPEYLEPEEQGGDLFGDNMFAPLTEDNQVGAHNVMDL